VGFLLICRNVCFAKKNNHIMTTNVFDETKGYMATDSRWSIRQGKYVVYLDDTGCDKILIMHNRAIMFAGNGGRIQQWKDWLQSEPKDDSGQPKEEGICICIADIQARKVKRSIKQKVISGGGYFAGTGTDYAVPCWLQNKDAKRSVDTAKQADMCSGGEVKYVDFIDGSHNLYRGSNVTIQMVDNAILKRGLVMTTTNAQSVPFATAANDDTELADIRAKIAAGDLSASAPSDGMYEEWTDEEKAGLKESLAEMFGWETA
jgi:hypothetical protein